MRRIDSSGLAGGGRAGPLIRGCLPAVPVVDDGAVGVQRGGQPSGRRGPRSAGPADGTDQGVQGLRSGGGQDPQGDQGIRPVIRRPWCTGLPRRRFGWSDGWSRGRQPERRRDPGPAHELICHRGPYIRLPTRQG